MTHHTEQPREPDANGWMPISESPREGAVLAGFYRVNGSCIYNPTTVTCVERDWPQRVEHYVARQRVYPTHWRPLPAPPVTQVDA